MEMRTDVVERTLDELIAAGLQGFVQFAALPASPVPHGPGVYVILRDHVEQETHV